MKKVTTKTTTSGEVKRIGRVKRVQVRMPFGGVRAAWDCRRFGKGRIVAPKLPVQIELEPGFCLDLSTGEVLKAA